MRSWGATPGAAAAASRTKGRMRPGRFTRVERLLKRRSRPASWLTRRGRATGGSLRRGRGSPRGRPFRARSFGGGLPRGRFPCATPWGLRRRRVRDRLDRAGDDGVGRHVRLVEDPDLDRLESFLEVGHRARGLVLEVTDELAHAARDLGKT